MAVYKVPQDVEAEDKLLGPFSFRQFIYLIVAALAIFIAMAWILPAVWIAGIPYLVLLVASYLVLARIHTLATPRNLLAEELRAN